LAVVDFRPKRLAVGIVGIIEALAQGVGRLRQAALGVIGIVALAAVGQGDGLGQSRVVVVDVCDARSLIGIGRGLGDGFGQA
jgi:hypothetical protein